MFGNNFVKIWLHHGVVQFIMKNVVSMSSIEDEWGIGKILGANIHRWVNFP